MWFKSLKYFHIKEFHDRNIICQVRSGRKNVEHDEENYAKHFKVGISVESTTKLLGEKFKMNACNVIFN